MGLRQVDERAKLQFDYGWKWFESAARQRMTMFNYYLIITGILANALVVSYKEGYSVITVAIGVIGILTSLGFLSFDVRNRGMAAIGEDILEKLENEVIFPEDFVNNKGEKLGPLCVERRKEMREGQKRPLRSNVLKHKYWIWLIQAAFALFFLMAIFMATYSPNHGGSSQNTEKLLENIEKLVFEQTAFIKAVPNQTGRAMDNFHDDLCRIESAVQKIKMGIDRIDLEECKKKEDKAQVR